VHTTTPQTSTGMCKLTEGIGTPASSPITVKQFTSRGILDSYLSICLMFARGKRLCAVVVAPITSIVEDAGQARRMLVSGAAAGRRPLSSC
jgi:hypothetical protein